MLGAGRFLGANPKNVRGINKAMLSFPPIIKKKTLTLFLSNKEILLLAKVFIADSEREIKCAEEA